MQLWQQVRAAVMVDTRQTHHRWAGTEGNLGAATGGCAHCLQLDSHSLQLKMRMSCCCCWESGKQLCLSLSLWRSIRQVGLGQIFSSRWWGWVGQTKASVPLVFFSFCGGVTGTCQLGCLWHTTTTAEDDTWLQKREFSLLLAFTRHWHWVTSVPSSRIHHFQLDAKTVKLMMIKKEKDWRAPGLKARKASAKRNRDETDKSQLMVQGAFALSITFWKISKEVLIVSIGAAWMVCNLPSNIKISFFFHCHKRERA